MSFNNNLKRKADATSTNDAKKPKANASITSFFGAPKTTTSSTKAAVSSGATVPVSAGTVTTKFDKAAWVAKLTAEQRELLQLEINTLHESWLAHLKEEIVSREFLELKRFLKKEWESGKTIFPPKEEIYSWSNHTPLPSVKAVILGQDPYHNHNQAHGLCFSVRPPTRPPPSLENIYKGLKRDYPNFRPPPPPNTGLLTPWADRGILLLNTCLTVRAHEANSHSKKGWERFTQKVIDTVDKVRTRGVVFLAWGSPAAGRCAKVNKSRHCVLQCPHPSPLSAHRGFFDAGHFKKTNEWLQKHYGDNGPIEWSLDPSVSVLNANKEKEEPSLPAAPKPLPPKATNGAAKPPTAQPVKAPEDEFGDDDMDDAEALEAFAAAEKEAEEHIKSDAVTEESAKPVPDAETVATKTEEVVEAAVTTEDGAKETNGETVKMPAEPSNNETATEDKAEIAEVANDETNGEDTKNTNVEVANGVAIKEAEDVDAEAATTAEKEEKE